MVAGLVDLHWSKPLLCFPPLFASLSFQTVRVFRKHWPELGYHLERGLLRLTVAIESRWLDHRLVRVAKVCDLSTWVSPHSKFLCSVVLGSGERYVLHT